MNSSDRRDCILAVDDAPATLEVLQRNLAAEGYVVFTAANVTEAIKILDATPIDLVVTEDAGIERRPPREARS